MDLPILSAAALGLAVFTSGAAPHSAAIGGPVGGVATLVGERLYASETPIARWGDEVRADDLALESLGLVAAVSLGPDGEPRGLVVAVGGLWGFGTREVSLGMERVHLLSGADGAPRLVVDLSGDGAPLAG